MCIVCTLIGKKQHLWIRVGWYCYFYYHDIGQPSITVIVVITVTRHWSTQLILVHKITLYKLIC